MNHFGFTKLLVDDLDRTAAFYVSVCGLREHYRVESAIAGRPIQEILFEADAPGAATFVLLKFVGEPKASNNEVILGFVTEDAESFCARAVEAGGEIIQSPIATPEHGVKVGFVRDVEGHLIEVVELLTPVG